MSLSCSCSDDDGDAVWYWWPPKDYSLLATTKRKRCSSCKSLIDVGSTVAEFARSRPARTEIEERITQTEGDPEAIWLASSYLCEECADIWFSLSELGFECVGPGENMRSVAKEYHEIYQT